MIHKKIVQQKIKEFEIQSYVKESLKSVGLSSTKLQITPLGEKIIVRASRPGLIVGRKGQSIKKLTSMLKKKFSLENPQIEIDEVKDVRQDADIIAESIASYLERFGSARFKSIGHKSLEDAITGGALGIEILITGKVPSSRSKRWRFYKGYLKKSGDLSFTGVKKAYTTAHLKTGAIGIQVRIMPSGLELPDKIRLLDDTETVVEELDNVELNKAEAESSGKDVKENKTAKKSEKKIIKKTAKKATKKTAKKTVKKKTSKAEGSGSEAGAHPSSKEKETAAAVKQETSKKSEEAAEKQD